MNTLKIHIKILLGTNYEYVRLSLHFLLMKCIYVKKNKIYVINICNGYIKCICYT